MKKFLVLLSTAVLCSGILISCASTKEQEETAPIVSAVDESVVEVVTEPEEDVGLYK